MVFLDPGEKIDILQKVCATQGLTSFGWYCFFFTCGFNSRNAGIKCTKERSVKFGGKDTVLLCLRYWASLVSGCFDSTSHWNLWNWHCVASLREQFAATAGRQTLFEVCSVCSGFPSLMLFAWFASCAWKNGSPRPARILFSTFFWSKHLFLYSIQPLKLGKEKNSTGTTFPGIRAISAISISCAFVRWL